MAEKEKEVFAEEVALDELDNVAGGFMQSFQQNCVQNHYRELYGGRGFPNCAATVEENSNCRDNDACTRNAVVYTDMKTRANCERAWK